MNETIDDLKRQHLESYKRAVFELLKNNSSVLVDEDIMSLLKKPPLDSMDVIKCKFLDLAKRQKVILDTEELDKLINQYRKNIISSLVNLKNIRIDELKKIIDSFESTKNTDVIKFNKKDFITLNKRIRKEIKESINDSINKKIVKNVNLIFTNNTDQDKEKKIIADVTKYLTHTYVKQLLESIDIKILVKDTTLMNGVKEQGERYLFTKMNSHLLK